MAQDQRNTESSASTNSAGNPIATNGMVVVQQLAQSVMRGNMEYMGLASRRMRAQMDFSRAAMACRSPADFGQLGGQFWRDAFQDYTTFHQRMMALMGGAIALTGIGLGAGLLAALA